MPTLMARKYSTANAARFFQEKQKSAAIAPTWNAPMKMDVIQLIFPPWAARPIKTSVLGRVFNRGGLTRKGWGAVDVLLIVSASVVVGSTVFAKICSFNGDNLHLTVSVLAWKCCDSGHFFP